MTIENFDNNVNPGDLDLSDGIHRKTRPETKRLRGITSEEAMAMLDEELSIDKAPEEMNVYKFEGVVALEQKEVNLSSGAMSDLAKLKQNFVEEKNQTLENESDPEEVIEETVDKLNSSVAEVEEEASQSENIKLDIHEESAENLDSSEDSEIVKSDNRELIKTKTGLGGYPEYVFKEVASDEVMTTLEDPETREENTSQQENTEDKENLTTNEKKESIFSPEYLNLKNEFKQAKAEYKKALEGDYEGRSKTRKFFGIGQHKLGSEAASAYEKYKEANNKYHAEAEASGVYDRVVDRLSNVTGTNEDGTPLSANLGITNRHLYDAADAKIKVQSERMPENLRSLGEKIKSKINPDVAKVLGSGVVLVGGVMKVVNWQAAIAAYGANKVGSWYVGNRENKHKENELSIIDNIRTNESALDALEDYYVQSARNVQHAKTAKTALTLAAVLAAGGALTEDATASVSEALNSGLTDVDVNPLEPDLATGSGEKVVSGKEFEEAILKESQLEGEVTEKEILKEEPAEIDKHLDEAIAKANEETLPTEGKAPLSEITQGHTDVEALPTETKFESEMTHEVKKHEKMYIFLLENLRDRLDAGELKLPEGFDRNELSSKIYQTFPEFTDAQDVSPRLTAEQWVKIGVNESAIVDGQVDFTKLHVGQEINMQALVDEMFGQEATSVGSETITVDSGPVLSNDTPHGQSPVEMSDAAKETVSGSSAGVEKVSMGTGEDYVRHMVMPDGNEQVVTSHNEYLEAYQTGSTWDEKTPGDTPAFEGTPYSGATIGQVQAEGFSMTEVYQNQTDEFLRVVDEQGQPIGMYNYLLEVIKEGVQKGEVTIPSDISIDMRDYTGNLEGFVADRLPELDKGMLTAYSDALSSTEWSKLGVSSGDPRFISENDTLPTGKLIQFLFDGDKEALFKTA
jgi:hypothetical protein